MTLHPDNQLKWREIKWESPITKPGNDKYLYLHINFEDPEH